MATVLLLAALLDSSTGRAQEVSESIEPGQAYVTRFSGASAGGEAPAIDVSGIVGSIVDVRGPGQAPQGHHWLNEPQQLAVTAGEVGQVFGIAYDDASPPNIYLTATSSFGLHLNADGASWMSGQWGPGGGPGTIWKLSAADGYKPLIFAHISLDGRQNTAAALGGIVYDRQNKQFFVSDLETGMIHRLKLEDGSELGRFDHGADGRASFFDAASGSQQSLPGIVFDPASSARLGDCPSGNFSETPACWNFADFRRRVWGIGLRAANDTAPSRLYYGVWSSQGFENPDFAGADDGEKRNTLWSVAIGPDGEFDRASVRRENFLPDFFLDPQDIERAGYSNAVSDIEFPKCTPQPIMLVAERGAARNLGLGAESPFAFPHESRVLRFEPDEGGVWQPTGRFDIGYYDRKNDKQPYQRANGAGGVDFGFGYQTDWTIDPAKRNLWAWMTGDDLCSPFAPCFNPDTGQREDGSEVHGIQGTPLSGISDVAPTQSTQPYPDTGEPYPPVGPQQSWMIDEDENVGPDGLALMDTLTQKNATEPGDIEIYEPCEGDVAEGEPGADEPLVVEEEPPIVDEPPVVDGPPETLPPPIIDEPPTPEGPDLEKIKDGPALCNEGGICTFTITITNLGPGTWAGPLMELDTLPPGATLLGYAPQPEWQCNQAPGSPFVDCYHDFITLLPGESVQLVIDLLLPVGLVGLVENCIEDTYLPSNDPFDPAVILAIERILNAWGYLVGPIDGILDVVTMNAIAMLQADSGLPVTGIPDAIIIESLFPMGISGDYNPANDRDCHTVNIVPLPLPPPNTPPDIEVLKSQLSNECRPGELCSFEILFINRGQVPWTGNPTVTDTLPPGATLDSNTPPWICAQAGTVTCRHPLEMTLQPGDLRQVTITVRMPPDLVPGIENCIEILWQQGTQDGNPGNDRMCIPVRVGPPRTQDIEIQKVMQGACLAGQDCTFDLWFINRGPGAWTGVPAINEVLPPGATLKSVSAPWVQAGGAVSQVPSITLPPMQSLKATVVITMPATIPPGTRNCARISLPADYIDPVLGNNEDCVAIPPSSVPPPPPPQKPELPDFGMNKLQKTPACTANGSCTFEIQLRNHGPGPWTDHPELIDTLPTGASLESFSAPWACTQDGARLICRHPDIFMPPGSMLTLTVTIKMPGQVSKGLENCIEISWGATRDHNPANDRYCVPIDVHTPAPLFLPKPPKVMQPPVLCPRGSQLVNGHCVERHQEPPMVHCPDGTIKKGNVCVRVEPHCPHGTVKKGKNCVRIEVQCPAGTVKKGKRCVRIEVQCPEGTVKKGKRCVRIDVHCPAGTVKKGKRCVPIVQQCPPGTQYNKKRRRCVPIHIQKPNCPFGTIPVGRLCVRIKVPHKQPHTNPGHINPGHLN